MKELFLNFLFFSVNQTSFSRILVYKPLNPWNGRQEVLSFWSFQSFWMSSAQHPQALWQQNWEVDSGGHSIESY
jgi:hypothetical protein